MPHSDHKPCEPCRDVLAMVVLDLEETTRYIKDGHLPPKPSVANVIKAARGMAEAWNGIKR